MSSVNLTDLLRRARHQSQLYDPNMGKLLQQIQEATARQESARKELEKLWSAFADTIRQEREERRVTLVELGKLMGVSKSALSYMESGQRSWTLDLAERAVRALQ